VLFLIAGAVLSAGVFGRQEVKLPERAKETEFQKRISVNYVLLDVVVTDRSGNYVRGLTKDDLVVTENGKPVKLESIDEYQMLDLGREEINDPSALTTALQQPPRNIIIFFDLFYSSSYGIRRAIEMAEQFVMQRVQPGDHVLVLSYFNGLRTVQPFTSDKTQVIKAMREMGFASDLAKTRAELATGMDFVENSSLLGDRPFEGDSSDESFQGDLEGINAVHNARNYLLSLQALAKAMKFHPGRKTLIMLSEGMNFDLIDPTNVNFDKYGPGGRLARTAGRPPVSVSLFSDFQRMIQTLNDSKVSLYTINVAGLVAPGDAHKRLVKVDPLSEQQDFTAGLDNRRNRQDFLSSVSKETGGRAYFNANNILALLNKIDVDISNYYIVGYRSQFNPNKSQYRKISVKARKRGLRVLHRKGYYTPRPFASLSADERDLHLAEGFLTRNALNELDARVDYFFYRPSHEEMKLYVCITVPFERLEHDYVCITVPFERLEHDRGGIDFEALVSDLDSEAKIVSSVHKRYTMETSDNPELQRRGLRIVEALASVEGVNRIRIALRDNKTGKRSYFYYNFRFRKADADALLLSNPLFFDQNDLLRSVNEFGLKATPLSSWNVAPPGGSDDLTHPTAGRLFPLAEPVFGRGDEVSFLLTISNLKRDLVDGSELNFDFALSPVVVNGEEREYFRVIPAKQEIFRRRSGDGIVLLAKFQMGGNLEPGLYDMVVVVSDKATGRQAAGASRLTVE